MPKLNRLQKIVSGIFGALAFMLTIIILNHLDRKAGSMLWPVVSLVASGCFFIGAASD